MPCCKAEKYGWCKDLPIVDYKDEERREYCVFHAPKGKKEVSAPEFNRLITERINLAQRNNKSCDFSGAIFEWNVSFDQFSEGMVLPPIKFSEVNFIGKATFEDITFSEVDFFGVRFDDETSFYETKFSKKSDFSWARFNNEVYFGGVVFHETEFSKAIFNAVVFNKATFNNEAYFDLVTFKEISYFLGRTFIKGSSFIGLNILDRIIFEDVNLEKVSFISSDLRKIDFINCIWPKRFGRFVLYDEIILFGHENQLDHRFRGNLFQILKHEWSGCKKDISCSKRKILKVEILYRMIKQKYKEEHNEYEVSNWHYGEKEMFRKGNPFRRFFPLSLSNLYWLSSGYGERPVRAGIALISLISILSILTAMSGLKPPEGGFAAIILNTLQYATLQKETVFKPVSLSGAYLKLFAQILIPVQTALFALAIKNRFKR